MLSNYLREIEKSASNILDKNWRFFYNFNSEKYALSREKVIGELLVYLIISSNRKLYKRIFSEDYNLKRCFQRLQKMEKVSPNRYISLKPNEKLASLWLESEGDIDKRTTINILRQSELFLEGDLYLCNYLDLYNFTHDFFGGFDFGKSSVIQSLSEEEQVEIIDKSISNFYFALLEQHIDLASEYAIVLLCWCRIKLISSSVKKIKQLLEYFCTEIVEPFLKEYKDVDFQKDYKVYHTILVIGMFGSGLSYGCVSEENSAVSFGKSNKQNNKN